MFCNHSLNISTSSSPEYFPGTVALNCLLSGGILSGSPSTTGRSTMNMCVAELFTNVTLGFRPMAADADAFVFVRCPAFVVIKYLGLTPFDMGGVLGGVSSLRCLLRLGGGVVGGVPLPRGSFSPSLLLLSSPPSGGWSLPTRTQYWSFCSVRL
jgi:hypothetical protein